MSNTQQPYVTLVEGEKIWTIDYYQIHPVTGIRHRFRKTYGLNKIKDLKLRYQRAQRYIKEIEKQLKTGWPFDQVEKTTRYRLKTAVDMVVELKIAQTDRQRTVHMYCYIRNIFFDYLRHSKNEELFVDEFTKVHAIKFLDYGTLVRKVQPRTINNYLLQMKSLFYTMEEREIAKVNPFKGLKKRATTQKERRAFTDDEKLKVMAYVYTNDAQLLMAIGMIFYCFVRPIELTRLRFRHFNLNTGVIKMPGAITKNRKTEIITIPDVFLEFIRSTEFASHPKDYLIFGQRGEPHATQPVGVNTLNLRHRKILDRLHSMGILGNIKGLSLYSWKDTGVLDLAENKVNILEIMQQLRHADLRTTQAYTQSLSRINQEIKVLNLPLIPKSKSMLNPDSSSSTTSDIT